MQGVMMGDLFFKLLNISITAGWLILAIVCVRLLFKKMPKWVTCLLWGLVAVRLILPFSIESVFSLQPSAEPIRPSTVMDGQILNFRPSVDSGVSSIDDAVNPVLFEMFDYPPMRSAAPLQIVTAVAVNVWLLGMIVLVLFAVISVMRLRFQVRESVRHTENIFLCDRVQSPFILGSIRPKVYLPSGLSQEEMEYVIAHEKAHLRRKDHWWKPIGYLLLCVYWFQPLCWLAYILLCKDIELACDEKVIRQMSMEDKKEYSRVLLSCATQRHLVVTCPLAFGEVGVKERVKTVLNYKKPAFWITVAAIVLCVVVAVCFLTTPEESSEKDAWVDEWNADATDAEGAEGTGAWVTEEIHLEKRDVTHDGVEDFIVTSMKYDPSIIDPNLPLREKITQQIRYDVVNVSVYDGQGSPTAYSEKQLLWSQDYSWVHVGNGQVSIVQVDGKDYLLTSNLWAGQGAARWTFEIFSLNTTGEKETVDQQTIEFTVGDEDVTGERVAFREAINQYIGTGVLIAALDVDLDVEEQFISAADNEYAPLDYYGQALVKFDALEKNETLPEGNTQIDVSKIAEIEITNGDTGVRKKLAPKEQYSQEYYNYNDLLKLYRQLGLTSQYEPNSRVGYKYCMWLKDAEGKVLQTVTPYKDGLTVDGIFYQYDDTDENAAASLRLMEYMEYIFHQDICSLPKAPDYLWPTASQTMSTTFGEHENGVMTEHINIAGAEGDDVIAIADGKILETGYEPKVGGYIILDLGNGVHVKYGHLEKVIAYKGMEASKGQMIGILGKTGMVTGPNLLFAIYVNGMAVDPLTYEGGIDGNCVLVLTDPNWGINLTATNVTPTGVTIHCTQSGGEPTGELQTGSYYVIEKYVEGAWEKVEYLPHEHEIAWTAEAWGIPKNEVCQWEVNWEWLYGKLQKGRYRIGKDITDFRGTGDYDQALHYAEFEVKN